MIKIWGFPLLFSLIPVDSQMSMIMHVLLAPNASKMLLVHVF